MEVTDPKFKALRQKLDRLYYTQTLHPDSY